ncbi:MULTISPECIES: RnfABCDGE type electron transport complex subunit G [unclassified Clostridium]|uniref:RnfABCDGE type electron transport complex subunit G n=1 Tax=unclassified Clostridium TaxID=2614128 RepID=UPI000EDD812B|nr:MULTISPECIES: RnfABCDGE type electron transport complex subunit G [unclassified Clostridium]HCQ90923.1 electron transporter RnfG [Clostridium sp.]
MKENLKLGGILLVITAIAGIILGIAYSVTMGPIMAKEKEAKNAAMREILPDAEDFQEFKFDNASTPEIIAVQSGVKGGANAGYCINVSTSGYGGPINMMIGISSDGTVKGIKILSHTETPGLGAKAEEPEFTDKFKEKKADSELTVVKGDASGDDQIAAISGATITSKAVADGVNIATKAFNEQLKGAQ